MALPLDNNDDDDYVNYHNFEETYEKSHPQKQNKTKLIVIIGIIAIVIVSGLFLYDDSTQTIIKDDSIIFENYNIGNLGSDHAHTAITIFINGDRVNFAQEQFQLKSSYVHFENNNPYQIHRHATNVPVELLFDSIGIKITKECIIVSAKSYCDSMKFFVNEKQYDDITGYVPNHNDRILISLGEGNISEQLEYLKSLQIHDLPKKTPKEIPNDNSVYI